MDNKTAVIEFIEKERIKGTSDQEIQHQLLDAGWQMDIIQRAMGPKPPTEIQKAVIPIPEQKWSLQQKVVAGTSFGIVVLMLIALFI